jgi:hypothetical protein
MLCTVIMFCIRSEPKRLKQFSKRIQPTHTFRYTIIFGAYNNQTLA